MKKEGSVKAAGRPFRSPHLKARQGSRWLCMSKISPRSLRGALTTQCFEALIQPSESPHRALICLVLRALPGAFLEPSRSLPGTFPDHSRSLPGIFPEPSRRLPGAFPEPVITRLSKKYQILPPLLPSFLPPSTLISISTLTPCLLYTSDAADE